MNGLLAHRSTGLTQRADIQALRGIAVLLVLGYHARMPFINGGYLGVDIFFVISGFLITRLISRQIDAEFFDLANFYWTRAWRLLPAAYATVGTCIVLAPFILTSQELSDFSWQVLGAVTLTANVALWMQTGYFDDAALLKPLLHFWSLAIEEQYYLFLPLALVCLPRRWWLVFIALITLLSVYTYLAGSDFVTPRAAFFLLPSRAWELGFGSIAALCANLAHSALPRAGQSAAAIPLILIAALTVHPLGRNQTDVDTLIACVATVALLLFPLQLLERGFFARALGWFGDRSYSLYLVHWPIFAFLHSAYPAAGGVAWQIRILALAVAITGSCVLYWTVEKRFRSVGRTTPKTSLVICLVLIAVSLALISQVAALWARSQSDMANRLRRNVGLDESCSGTGPYVRRTQCENSPSPTTLVWGDSFAMHLVPGLIDQGAELIQATRAKCAPLFTVAHNSPQYSRSWGESCLDFNQGVLNQLAKMPTVDVVVLGGHWLYLLDGELLRRVGQSSVIDKSAVQIIEEAISQTVAIVQATGKRVVIVEDPPWAGFDAGKCQEKLIEGKLVFGSNVTCRISRATYDRRTAEMRKMLERIARAKNVGLFRPAAALCSETDCDTRWGNVVLYDDDVHLSREGSIALAARTNMLAELRKIAR